MLSRALGEREEVEGREDEVALIGRTTDLSCILWFGGNRN